MKWNQNLSNPPAPSEAPEGGGEPNESIEQTIQSAVAEGFSELRKELAPARRFTNPVESETFRVPANVKRYSSLKHFAGPGADERAYRFGMFCLGVYGKRQGVDFCLKQGIPLIDAGGESFTQTKTQRENVNTSSGFLVPDEFQNDLIDLREKFGVFRQNAKIVPMASDTRSDPRRVNGITAYFVGESSAAALSDKQWDRVRLTAKKLMVLTKYSNELNEDAVLNIGDDLAGEIAYAFALKEDQCGFIGDGSSQFGGIVGVVNRLLQVDPTGTNNPGNVQGLIVSSGTGYASSYNSMVLSDFNRTVATLPEFADVPGETKWYCSKLFWGSVMQKLAAAAGGNRVADVQNGELRKSFLGYEVVISQVLPKVSSTSQVCCLFGNLRMAARLGDRRHTTIQMSEHALNAFEQDEVVIRGTERFDIVVHDVGDPSSGAGPAKTPRPATRPAPLSG